MTATPSAADWEKARNWLAAFERDLLPGEWIDLKATLAQALADERGRVTARFLAVANELDGWRENAERLLCTQVTSERAQGRIRAYERAIDLIRAAADEEE